MAVVTIDGLECEVIYNISAGGTLNGDLVGPRSSYETINAGPCPEISSSTVSPTITPSPNTCKDTECIIFVLLYMSYGT